MEGKKIIQLLGRILIVIIINIAVLSPGLLGVEIGGDSAFQTAFGITLLVISFIVVVYSSYTALFSGPDPATLPPKAIQTHGDYVAALSQYKNIGVLKKDIDLAFGQLERMARKRNTMQEVLTQRFDPSELSYKKFAAVIYEVEKLFYLNIRGMLNKLGVFDATDFLSLSNPERTARFSRKLLQEKQAFYNEYMASVVGYLGANEEIMLKLDKLLLEISRINSTDYREIEEMPCMKEIDALIKHAQYYKD